MKIKELQKILREKKLGFAIFSTDDPFTFYFSGQSQGDLIIPSKGSPYILSNRLEYELVKKVSKVKVMKFENPKEYVKIISKKVKGNYAINHKTQTLNHADWYKKSLKGKLNYLPKEVYDLRKTKTWDEIKIIKRNVSITCKIFNELFRDLKNDSKRKNKKFKYETDIRDYLDNRATKLGCTLSYPTIVASGKNSSMPHYHPVDKVKLKGFTVIDFGVKRDGYCSDITRTIYFGKPSKKEKADYEKVLEIQKKMIKMIRPRTYFKILQEISQGDLGKPFIHSLGHGFGIEIHEDPFFRGEEQIQMMQTFTIEPGIYYPGKYGIRIEDDIFVSDHDVQILSMSLTKELLVF